MIYNKSGGLNKDAAERMMKKVLLVVSAEKKDAENLAVHIAEYLAKHNFQAVVYRYDGYDGLTVDTKKLEQDFAFVISLGGDGNVLFASRFAGPKNIPVLPINFGQFGFIANIQPDEWKTALEDFLAGKQEAHLRMLLDITVKRENKIISGFTALNEAVVSGSGVAKLISVELSYTGLSFGVFRADGLIVATPTGSTAYAVASGGPILDPTMYAFVVAPVAPFTLSNRPLVLPASEQLVLKILPQRQKNLILSVDGQESVKLHVGDEVIIGRSAATVNLVGCSQKHFYEVLRAKLGWSGSFKF